jgi:serine/threonine protein kinase/tetratricopeptide (TPR) repeat protein
MRGHRPRLQNADHMDQDVRVLFQKLADLSPTEREEYYVRQNVSDATRAEVESLLTFDDETPNDSVSVLVGSVAGQFLESDPPVAEGGRCGPYRLVRLLGHGGMGAVYLAERADGELEQRVAIKFLRAGAHSPSLHERFLRERQILASLNHPGIARLLDVGHTGGQPYLVMEYVDGTRIDQYVETLGNHDTLLLFMPVCEAVSYAHRNLVIHRDLKPSNILIDAAGRPKLLDFGIAKILDAPEDTLTIDRLMTPEYASPEQARGDAQTTATDVYSLGAVLYRLLTGKSPQAPDAATSDQLPKDLGFIVRKAMRAEPEERYASVDAFCDDIAAYLEHRPVRARRANAWYVMRMFVRRYRLAVTAGALAIAGLSGGLIVAERSRAVAERRFDQVRQLSNKLFELDAQIRDLPGTTEARHRIVASSLEYLEGLGSKVQPSRWRTPSQLELDLAFEIGTAYMQVARIQGVPGQPNLGQFVQARESLSKATSFVESMKPAATGPLRRKALILSAEIAHDSMILASTERRDAEALEFARKSAEQLAALQQEPPAPITNEATRVTRIYSNIALFHSNAHLQQEAESYARRAVDMARRIESDQRPLSAALGIFSNTARFSGDLEGALQAIRESRTLAEKLASRDDENRALALAAALWREALILGEVDAVNMNRPQEAIPLLERALDLAEGMARRDPSDYTSRSYVFMAGSELGDILRTSDPHRALAIYDATRNRLAEVRNNPKSRRDEATVLASSSYALRLLGRPEESRQRIDGALGILGDLHDYPTSSISMGEPIDGTLRALADHYGDTGQTAAAITTYQDLLEKVRAAKPQAETDLRHANSLSRLYRDLGNLHRRAGHASEADTLDRQRVELWQGWDKKLPNNPFVQRQLAETRLR